MKIAMFICNVVLFAFTCFVLLTDGVSKEAGYIAFTLLLLLVPILNLLVISRGGARVGRMGLPAKEKELAEQRKMDSSSSSGTVIKIVAIVCNAVLLGFVCWALVDQYPHPEEDGFIAYVLLVVVTPALSLVALFRGGAGNGWLVPLRKRKA